MGKGQVIWALGKTVCDALGIQSFILAGKISLFFEEINKIELNTTSSLLTMPLEEVKAMVKSIAIQDLGECWL